MASARRRQPPSDQPAAEAVDKLGKTWPGNHVRELGIQRPSILVVESNAIIGWDVTEWLEETGCEVIHHVACGAALASLRERCPTAALLDVDLQSGVCVELARELRRQAIPLVIFSMTERRFALSEFHDLPWIVMPAPMQTIGKVLAEVLLDFRFKANPKELSRSEGQGV